MNELIKFEHEGHAVRAFEIEGEPWFVARDVCDILGLEQTHKALQGIDEEDLTGTIIRSGGQDREMKMVNEPGLYQLIFKSRTEGARRFKRKVTHEILPAIRKTGSYCVPGAAEEACEKPIHYLTVKAFLAENGFNGRLTPCGLGQGTTAYCKAMGFWTGKVAHGGTTLYPLHALRTVSARHLEASYPKPSSGGRLLGA